MTIVDTDTGYTSEVKLSYTEASRQANKLVMKAIGVLLNEEVKPEAITEAEQDGSTRGHNRRPVHSAR